MSNEIMIEETNSVRPISAENDLNRFLPQALLKIRLYEYEKIKQKIDTLAAEIAQRQEKMIFIKDLVGEIHTLTNDQQNRKAPLDLSSLKNKFKIAKELGVQLNEQKEKYDEFDLTRLIQNMESAVEKFDMQNRSVTSEIHKLSQHNTLVISMIKDTLKSFSRSHDNCIRNLK